MGFWTLTDDIHVLSHTACWLYSSLYGCNRVRGFNGCSHFGLFFRWGLAYFQVLAPGKIPGSEYNGEMLTVIVALVIMYSAHRHRQNSDRNTCSCCCSRSFHPQLLLFKSQAREWSRIKGGAKQVSEVLNNWNNRSGLFSELTQVIFVLSGKPQWHKPSPADGEWP